MTKDLDRREFGLAMAAAASPLLVSNDIDPDLVVLNAKISEGKLADFVMLAEDPHTVSPQRIKDIEIVRTVVGGETMYQH